MNKDYHKIAIVPVMSNTNKHQLMRACNRFQLHTGSQSSMPMMDQEDYSIFKAEFISKREIYAYMSKWCLILVYTCINRLC